MNRVLLVNVDSIIPNLALMKISAYHKAQGDIVGFNVSDPTHAYISCIFKKNKAICDSGAYMLRLENPNIIIDIGGPGYDLKKVLPPEIEDAPPSEDMKHLKRWANRKAIFWACDFELYKKIALSDRLAGVIE